MSRRKALVAVILILLGTAGAHGQNPASLDPEVSHVVGGGRWSGSPGVGWYRAIIRTGGFEHVVSDLTLQWIQEQSALTPGLNGPVTVVSSMLISGSACSGRRDDPTLTKHGETWRLAVLCTDTHGGEKPFRMLFALGTPGVYSRIEAE